MLTKEELERIHGGPIGIDTVIPGAVPVAGRGVVYFSHEGQRPWSKQFDAITTYSNPPHAQHGGVGAAGLNLALPDGSVFYAIDYHGDLAGWRQDIEEGATGLNITLARIDGDKFVVADGRVFALSDCVLKLDKLKT
jgi:hypothetical protein